MGWVVKTTPRPLYPRERPRTHHTGDYIIMSYNNNNNNNNNNIVNIRWNQAVDKRDSVFLFKDGAGQASPNIMVQAAAIKTSHNAAGFSPQLY